MDNYLSFSFSPLLPTQQNTKKKSLEVKWRALVDFPWSYVLEHFNTIENVLLRDVLLSVSIVSFFSITHLHGDCIRLLCGWSDLTVSCAAGWETQGTWLWSGTRVEALKVSWSTSTSTLPRSSLASTSKRSHTKTSGEQYSNPSGTEWRVALGGSQFSSENTPTLHL